MRTLYQGHEEADTGSLMLCPRSPDMGRNSMSFLGLYPQLLRKGVSLVTISSYRSLDHVPSSLRIEESSILFTCKCRIIEYLLLLMHMCSDS